jgi:hypothetical protein
MYTNYNTELRGNVNIYDMNFSHFFPVRNSPKTALDKNKIKVDILVLK